MHYSRDDSTGDDLDSDYEIRGDFSYGDLDKIDCSKAVEVDPDTEPTVNVDAKLLKKGIASVDITMHSKRFDEGFEGVFDPDLGGNRMNYLSF